MLSRTLKTGFFICFTIGSAIFLKKSVKQNNKVNNALNLTRLSKDALLATSHFLGPKDVKSLNLTRLPDDPLLATSHFLAPKDVKSLALTHHRFYRLFKSQEKNVELLEKVFYAKYSEAEELASSDLALIFNKVNFKFPDNHLESISPLKYALKVKDKKMCEMFLKKIAASPKYLELFLNQVEKQEEYLDLQPLFAAYQNFDVKDDVWVAARRNHRNENELNEVNEAWFEVCKQQRKLLPWHMVNEFSYAAHWAPDANFDIDDNSRPIKILKKLHYEETTEITSLHSDTDYGVSMGLVRGAEKFCSLQGGREDTYFGGPCIGIWPGPNFGSDVQYDSETLSNRWLTKSNEFDKFIQNKSRVLASNTRC